MRFPHRWKRCKAWLFRSGRVEPFAPLFLSYRQSDGTEWAHIVAWSCRAVGLPIWQDVSDLPPGNTEKRLATALASGLSGGILIVTPEIEYSNVVKDIEAPRLLRLHRHSDFALAICNLVHNDKNRLDYAAPDRLLNRPRNQLKQTKQYDISTDDGLMQLTRDLSMFRMRQFRESGERILTIDVQSRATPNASTNAAPLSVRTHPPLDGSRTPPRIAWEGLKRFTTLLPEIVVQSGAKSVEFSGGAHLSVAFAIGAALPVTSFPATNVTVRANNNDWHLKEDDSSFPLELHTVTTSDVRGESAAVFIDTTPSEQPGDSFQAFLDSQPYAHAFRVEPLERRLIEPKEFGATVNQIANHIRQCAANTGTTDIHLFLRTSFPLALHLGRLLNTLRIELFEWDDQTSPATYQTAAVVSPGHTPSPILEIRAKESA